MSTTFLLREKKKNFAPLFLITVVTRKIHVPKGTSYLDKTVPEIDPISKVGPGNMTVERSRVELCQHKDLVYAAIDAIAHRNINQTVTSSHCDLQITHHLVIKLQT